LANLFSSLMNEDISAAFDCKACKMSAANEGRVARI